MAIPVRNFFFLQLFILLFLIGMHFFPESLSFFIHKGFNLDGESNFPTWYSTILLFSVSLSSLGIYVLSVDSENPRIFWLFFSFAYCFLSMDEAVGIHEFAGRIASTEWVFIYAPFAAIFFMVCFYYLNKRKNRVLCNWVLSGLIVYAAGGLVTEFISYLFHPFSPGLQDLVFVLEEGLEMLGSIIVLTGCLQEVNCLWAGIRTKAGL